MTERLVPRVVGDFPHPVPRRVLGPELDVCTREEEKMVVDPRFPTAHGDCPNSFHRGKKIHSQISGYPITVAIDLTV